MKRRTDEERFADKFDLELFRLVEKAGAQAPHWHRISRALRAVRPMVRGMMHPDDRKETT